MLQPGQLFVYFVRSHYNRILNLINVRKGMHHLLAGCYIFVGKINIFIENHYLCAFYNRKQIQTRQFS